MTSIEYEKQTVEKIYRLHFANFQLSLFSAFAARAEVVELANLEGINQ